MIWIMYILVVVSVLNFYAALEVRKSRKALKRAIKTTYTGRIEDELKDEVSSSISFIVEGFVKEHKEDIHKFFKEKLEEDFINSYWEHSSKPLEHAINKIAEQAADNYLAENKHEIMSALDLKAVTNAMLLKLTGQILNSNGRNEELPYHAGGTYYR